MGYLRTDAVHDMAKLVEVSLDLLVVQQRGFVRCRLGEVADHRHNRFLSFTWNNKISWLRTRVGKIPGFSREVRRQLKSPVLTG